METTDYCDYKLSIALKACGFDEPCGKSLKIIPGTEREEWDEEECQWCTVQDIEYYPKISLWQAQKWLREKWDLHIDVYPIAGYMFDADDQICEEWNYWTFDIVHVMSTRKIVVDEEQYGSYEEALTEGIKSALELITKGE